MTGALDGYTFHGRTDPAIVRDLAPRWGVDPERAEAGVDDCLRRYVARLRDEVAEGHIEVLPGVRELVTALAADRRVVLGLLTGNVAEGAAVKLAPTGVARLFKFGAYGSDSASRPDLPAVAVRRAEELIGRRFAGKEIAVIGDTPADIDCGASLGVKAIAVATGTHPVDELAAHAPTTSSPTSPTGAPRTRRSWPEPRPARDGVGSRAAAPQKRSARSNARSMRRRLSDAHLGDELAGHRAQARGPSMQWPVARTTLPWRGLRPMIGSPSGVSGRGPAPHLTHGPVLGQAEHARGRRAGGRDALGRRRMSQPASSRVLPSRSPSPIGVSTTCGLADAERQVGEAGRLGRRRCCSPWRARSAGAARASARARALQAPAARTTCSAANDAARRADGAHAARRPATFETVRLGAGHDRRAGALGARRPSRA